MYHVLRLISIWAAERFPSLGKDPHNWLSLVQAHQSPWAVHEQHLACCWIFSIVFQIPYFQHNTIAKRTSKETFECLPTSICLSSPWSLIMKFTTYVSVSLDLIFITLVIILNGFIINLLWRQRRTMQAAPCNKHASGSKYLACAAFHLRCVLALQWHHVGCSGLGLLKHSFENSSLGVLLEYCLASIIHPVLMSMCLATGNSTSLSPVGVWWETLHCPGSGTVICQSSLCVLQYCRQKS